MKEKIKDFSEKLGLFAIGIAKADRAVHADHLVTWLSQGLQAGMRWMERQPERRQDPRCILPGARSVIVVAWNYFMPMEINRDQGIVARYARGEDYHDRLRAKLLQLAKFIDQETGSISRVTVDTSAVLERDWAQVAGIGWTGKNTMTINSKLGSWFLLGEILTTLELMPSDPHRSLCGSCTRCLDACPTKAFTKPYQLDARKCISYLTIEHKGEIPQEFHRAMGQRIFGCDICQEVCPWNRFSKVGEDFAKTIRRDLATLDPQKILEWTESDFEENCHGTSLERLGLERLQRNARIVHTNLSLQKLG